MTTEKLYYIDSHLFDFEATVLDCRETEKGWAVILDRTAFFPEGGGQQADTGFIGAAPVTDVQERGGEILHSCGQALPVGAHLPCRIDREQRLVRMQNHSGEHIVSGLAHKLYGCENVGFHMGEDCMTIDFDRELSWQQLMEVETLANKAVRDNLPVLCSFPEGEALEKLEYRSKLELTENVRIVEIPGIDRCACCAPHVARTGEIGIIKFVEAEKYKGGIRIHAHCGFDALLDYREKNNAAGKISSLLSVKKHEIADGVERILSENLRLSAEKAELSAKLCKNIADGVAPISGVACVFEQGIGASGMRIIANTVAQKSRAVAVFDKKADSEYSFVIASQHGIAKELMSLLSQKFNIKGGGSDKMVQGTACGDACEIEKLLKSYQ